jgi:hypothetical protein
MSDASVHMGKPPPNYNFQEWARTVIHFHGFEGLPNMVESNTFTCVGHQWRLVLYKEGAYDAEQLVSVELIYMSDKHIKIACKISVGKSSAGNYSGPTIEFDVDPTHGTARCLIKDIAKRENIMKSLVDGTLVIGVAMKLADPTEVPSELRD